MKEIVRSFRRSISIEHSKRLSISMLENHKYGMLQRWFSPDEIALMMGNEDFRAEFAAATSDAALDELVNRGISILPSWSSRWLPRPLDFGDTTVRTAHHLTNASE